MTATTDRGIITPEAIRLDFATAGIATRMFARMLDLLIQFVMMWILTVMLSVVLLSSGSLTEGVIAFVILTFLLLFAYPALFESAWGGRTPGKAIMKLRVVTVEGGPVSFRHTAIRSMMQLVDFVLIPGGAIALLTGMLTTRTQRVGDLVAGTFVIREGDAKRNAAVQFPPPPGTEGFVATLDVTSLSSGQHEMIRHYLLRGNQLSARARNEISTRMVAGLHRQLNQPLPSAMHPETYLHVVLAAHQRLHGDPLALSMPSGSLPPPPSAAESILAPPPALQIGAAPHVSDGYSLPS